MSSAGVTINILDLSQPTAAPATGIPAGVIGTAESGPAFVPVTFTNYDSWKTLFGQSGDRFGPIAVSEWLANASQATYVRVLGAGDGNKRNATSGQVTNAGFVVGTEQVGQAGTVSRNTYAALGGTLGRTHFLGCFMSESAGSTVLSEAGLQSSFSAIPIIRGIIMTPSGVALTLSGNCNSSNQPAATSATLSGGLTGSISIASSQFTILLNGHTSTSAYPNVITASFEGDQHIKNVLNKDPALIQQAGHCLYSFYDIPTSLAVVTGTNVLVSPDTLGDVTKQDAVFITTSSIARDASTTIIPNYENFRDRYATPHTPYFISQDFGGSKYSLFKVHTLSDGESSNSKYRVKISNILPSSNNAYDFGSFDVTILDYTTDTVIKNFPGVNLDPTSTQYIARVIGDQHVYFDFDRASSSQRLVVEGDYPTTTPYVRVQMSSDALAGNVPATALPFGFRGYGRPITSGSIMAYNTDTARFVSGFRDAIQRLTIPPVPMRKNIVRGGAVADAPPWGTQLTLQSLTDFNGSDVYDDSVTSITKFLPSFHPTNANFFSEDTTSTDNFANNLFSIEKISVVTGSNTYADPGEWASATYVRAGNIVANDTAKTRALSTDDLAQISSRASSYVSYVALMQGGFDGVNIFDDEKSALTNLAAKREIDDAAAQGGATSGPTVMAYKKAIDIMGSKADTDIQLLATPGIRIPAITNYAITAVENRFDAMYIMDIEQRDDYNNVITGSTDVNITNTVSGFTNRNLNTSFAAAYFPDIVITSPDDAAVSVAVPPSVAVLGAYGQNDRVGSYWNAPAGFNRTSLTNVTDSVTAIMNDSDLDVLYDAAINPLVAFPGTGFVVWGQKTLLKAASSLDRVNVRRLLIFLRRQVRAVANSLVFEPNTQATLDRFNALVNPILQRIQAGGGVDRYKVQIDTSTTTQADIENNTIRGKIYVQPTKTAEFISIDFVVTGRSATV
jgi:phage tail sheath protein FI